VDGSGHGIGDRAGWRTWLPAATLVGITLTFYHGLWLPGLVLVKRDAFRFFPQLKHYAVDRLSAGELPQWFPYEALGRAFIGATHTGVFHPFTALYFLLPIHDAYRASTLLSCLLAACGTFALARIFQLSPIGALFSGVAFALSGYVVSLTDNIPYLYSICVLPLFCAALEKSLGGGRAWVVAPAALWGSVLLFSDVQTGYYYGFIALLWTAARARDRRLQAYLKLALIVGLAAMLAGVQLGPAWAVFAGSERAEPEMFHDEALYWSTHPLRLLTLVIAPVGGHADPVDVAHLFFGSRPPGGSPVGFWAESLYLGVPMMGLAFLGARHRRDLRVLAWLGGLALLLSLGKFGGFYEIFYKAVPLWSVFRYPEKFMGVASFAIAMLGGTGLDALQAGKGRSFPWFAAALFCASAAIGFRTDAASAWTAASFMAPESLAREVTQSAALGLLFSAVGALGVGIVNAGSRKGSLRVEILLAALVAIVALDLARANLGAYHTGPAESATFIPPFAETLQAREGTLSPGRFRLLSIKGATLAAPEVVRRQLGTYGTTSVMIRQALDVEHNAQFHIESAKGYLQGYSAAFASMVRQKPGIEATARYNVAYYIGRRSHFQDPRFAQSFVAELPDYDLALYKNPVPAKPRVYLSSQPERAASPVDPAVLLARPDFLNGTVDVIETSDESLPGSTTGGTAVIEQYAPETIRVRVETAQSAALILLDTFDKGWRATLDGGPVIPILRANAVVRAVVVPAGTHVVTFRYETPLLRAGAMASLAGSLISLVLIASVRRPARTRQTIP